MSNREEVTTINGWKHRKYMGVEENKAAVRTWVAAWNRGDVDGLVESCSPKAVYHSRFSEYDLISVMAANAASREAFPDMSLEIEDLVGEGDRVVARLTARGTHRGSLLGVPPTGREIRCALIEIIRFDEGKVVEHWGITDELSLFEQLGARPALEAAI
jgi:steroid delta-isomerase-like uncharacterized protein